MNGEKRNTYKILAGESEEKRPLGRPRRRWLENIKMDLRMGWYWLDRDKWRTLVNTVMNFQVA
jgi:hypothetical protein